MTSDDLGNNAQRCDPKSLVEQAAQGDLDAKHKLFLQNRTRLKRLVAYRIDDRLRSRIDPSDIVQDSLITAHEQLDDYLADRAVEFYPWLRQITLNRLVDATRRHLVAQKRSVKREVTLQARLPDESAAHLYRIAAPLSAGPSQQIQKQELMQRVDTAMQRLPNNAREILELRFVEQLSTSETADVIGISVTAVQGRQVRALARLRTLLEDTSSAIHREQKAD